MNNEDLILNIIIFIIIILIVIIIVCIVKGILTSDYPETKIVNLDDNELNTGDIVIVGYNNFFGKIVRGFTSSIWTHSGILWRDPKTNFLYIIELGVYKKYKLKGIFKIPFNLWISANKKHIKGLLKYSGETKLSAEKMENIYNKYKTIELDKFNYKWYRFLYKQYYNEEKNRNIYTCFEFTIKLLQEMDIYMKNYLCSSYFPGDIGNNKIFKNLGHFYENVKLFEYIDIYEN